MHRSKNLPSLCAFYLLFLRSFGDPKRPINKIREKFLIFSRSVGNGPIETLCGSASARQLQLRGDISQRWIGEVLFVALLAE